MSKRTPHVWLNAWNLFVASFRPRQIIGKVMGEDHLGNKYYEIAADPSRGKRKPSRWFKPTSGEEGFDQEMPAEWEAWLRHRRSEPPGVEEVQRNQAIIHMKRKNAALLDAAATQERLAAGRPGASQDQKGAGSFPKYEEYDYADNKGTPKFKG